MIFLLKNSVLVFFKWRESKYLANLRAELSKFFFKNYLSLPRIFHLRTNSSETVKNITIETEYVVSGIFALSNIAMETIILFSIVSFLLFIDFKIALTSFTLLSFFALIIYNLNSKIISKMGKKRPKYVQRRLKVLLEALSLNKIFSFNNTQNKIYKEFDEQNFNIARIFQNIFFRNALPKPMFEIFILLLLILFIISILNQHNDLINVLPVLGTFLAAGYRLVPSFSRIMQSIQSYQFYGQAGNKLNIDKQKFELSKENLENKNSSINVNSIEIKNLFFSFEKNIKDPKLIFENLSMSIRQGEKIGIVGKSGSGKSTLIDIIMGLLPPTSGKVLIDNQNIKNVKNLWQKKIGCVAQETFVADDKLKNNIAIGEEDEKISEKLIKKSLNVTNLEEVSQNLKFGINTVLGQQGSRISGGQKQRIGIARAIYNNPEILILDEATSSLDSLNEKIIVKNLFDHFQNQTIIFVSHNLENLKFCNVVYEIENKKLKKISQ